jgi:hypothetical protein
VKLGHPIPACSAVAETDPSVELLVNRHAAIREHRDARRRITISLAAPRA